MIRNKLYTYGDDTWRIPAHIHVGKEVFDNMVKNKDIPAVINADTGEQRTHGQFAQMTANIALSLTRLGVKKGDVIATCSEKHFEVLPTIIGIICAGATYTPTDPTYGSFSLLHRLKISRPKYLFCSLTAYETHKASFEEVGSIQHYIIYGNETRDGAISFKEFLTETASLEDFEPVPVNGWEDLVFIVYSSGTTGLAKGIPVTHLGFLWNTPCLLPDMFRGAGIYNTREYYYTYGLMFSTSCLRAGATIIYNRAYEEKAMLEAVQKYKIRATQLTPMIITELLKSPLLKNYDLSSMDYVISSATYCRAELVKKIKETLPHVREVVQIYGMSEGGAICNELASSKGSRPGSSGMPSYGMVMKVVDLETREALGPHQRGEICVRGPSIVSEYINNLNPDFKDKDGFLKTGDVGHYDEDGFFYISSRIKELIKYNDISTTPAEFEELLLQLPSVREVCVVGKPHPKHGELPTAFVVLQPGYTATEDLIQELVQHVDGKMTYRMRLAGGVRFIDRIPRTPGDKLDRRNLVQRLVDEDAN